MGNVASTNFLFSFCTVEGREGEMYSEKGREEKEKEREEKRRGEKE